MKRLFYLLIILISFCSCSQKDAHQNNKVIIAGKVLKPSPDIFKINFSVNRIGIGNERFSKELENDGSFKISFESEIPTDVWLAYGMNILILTHPGDSIYIEFNGDKQEREDILKTIKFRGDDSTINKEAAIFQLMYFTNETYTNWERKENAIKEYDELKYKLFADSLRNEEANIINSFIEGNNPSGEVKGWARTFLDANYYNNLLGYPIKHRIVNKLARKDWNLPITYFDFITDKFTIENFSLISGYAISSFVNSFQVYVTEKIWYDNNIFFSTKDAFKQYPEKWDSLTFFGIIKHTSDPLLRQMILTEMLRLGLEQSDIRMFNRYEDEIGRLIVEPYLKEPLFKLYNQTLESLDKPELASTSILHKLSGTSLKSEIDSIISVNKGKVIYMDCWATWCGPCMAEMPNSKSLMEEYKFKDIAFVFICLDSEEKNWKSVISKYSLAGQHIFLSKKQSNDFREIFGINGIPHYILFNKKGDIFENMTLPPLFVKEKIDKLLSEK
jgi:thiol-disulfide isomerase/thioredoxin